MSRRREADLVDALELVGDPEQFADYLHRRARAARRRLPAAKDQQARLVEARNRLDRGGQRDATSRGIRKAGGRPVEGDQLERNLLRHRHHHLL